MTATGDNLIRVASHGIEPVLWCQNHDCDLLRNIEGFTIEAVQALANAHRNNPTHQKALEVDE